MRARIYQLASRLTQAVRANPFALCVLVLITTSAVLVPQNTRASGASRDVTPTDLLRDMRTQIPVSQVEHGQLLNQRRLP